MKRIAIAVVLGLALGAFGTSMAAPKKVEIRIAGMKAPKEPESVGMYNFGKYLEELSKGSEREFVVKVFPNSQLGKEKKYITDVRKGTIQMCATGTQTSSMHPAMAMLETPMMYDSYAHAHRAMNGKVFDLIADGFIEKSGMRVLNAFPLGFRHFYTKKPVQTIDDVKGLRMRVPNIPLYINFAKECGISGQPMAFAEVPGALDQGVIDGGDSPLADITSTKMYETCPQVTLTGHILVLHSLYINERFYQSLSDKEKGWVNEAAKRSAEDIWKLAEEVDAAATKEIESHGGKVSQPGDALKAHMKAAGERSWQLFLDPKSAGYVPNAKAIFDAAASYR